VKILAATRGDAASYYRIAAPFGILKYRGYDVDIGNLYIEAVADYDIVWLQMHASPMAELAARAFKDAGKPIVYDVDDWVFALPPSWSSYDHYFNRGTGQPNDRLRFHERLIELADVVTTTTTYLSRKIRKRFPGKDVRVLPNAVMMADWDVLAEIGHSLDGPVLGWFGTANHWDDWMEVVDAIDAALDDVGGYLSLMGAPECVTAFPERLAARTRWMPLVPMAEFHTYRFLLKACDVGLAWCSDRLEISRCRSPLKAYQWGAAGVPLVASRTVYGAASNGNMFPAVTLPELRDTLVDTLRACKGPEMQARVRTWTDTVYAEHSYELNSDLWLSVCNSLSPQGVR